MSYCIGKEKCGCEVIQDSDARVHIEYCARHNGVNKIERRMEMLLTNKEMRKLHELPDEYGKVYAIAMAQLRKVVEYLKPHTNIRTDAPYKSTIDADAWNALLKEMEE